MAPAMENYEKLEAPSLGGHGLPDEPQADGRSLFRPDAVDQRGLPHERAFDLGEQEHFVVDRYVEVDAIESGPAERVADLQDGAADELVVACLL